VCMYTFELLPVWQPLFGYFGTTPRKGPVFFLDLHLMLAPSEQDTSPSYFSSGKAVQNPDRTPNAAY
jgi:hypothetical protein